MWSAARICPGGALARCPLQNFEGYHGKQSDRRSVAPHQPPFPSEAKRKEPKEKIFFVIFNFNFIFIFNFKVCRRFCCGKMSGKPPGKIGAALLLLLCNFEPLELIKPVIKPFPAILTD